MTNNGVTVRQLQEPDLAEADRIMRLAFGTFLGLLDPMAFMGDADYVRTRFAADPSVALAAEVDGRLAGTNFVTRWGSVGFFGPLTVDPARWNSGVARALLDQTMAIFDKWGVTHAGLFTFGHSPKHVSLYQRYGFMPRFLTSVLGRPLPPPEPTEGDRDWATVGEGADPEIAIAGCAAVTDVIYPGLEVSREIAATQAQELGDTVLVHGEGGEVEAFGVCHTGPGSEAGTGTCYLKFGAARPGPGVEGRFGHLLDACEAFASQRGAELLVAGVNTGRRGAYRALLARGYKPRFIGVTMHRPDESAYHDDAAWVIDDWR
jgi:GNAT superfamily N-acetyltransferase